MCDIRHKALSEVYRSRTVASRGERKRIAPDPAHYERFPLRREKVGEEERARFFARNPQTMHNDVCHGQRKHSIKEMS